MQPISPEARTLTGVAADPADEFEAYAASLAALGVGRSTLRRLLAGRTPKSAWEELVQGGHVVDRTGSLALKADPQWPEMFASRLDSSRCHVLVRGRAGYPSALEGDIDPPEVLFCLGQPSLIEGRARVTIVGTRSSTRYGAEVANELASGLTMAGVSVVSGLAAGIDAAAHAGAVRALVGAPPIAVVATGVDIASPRSTAALRDAVAVRGAVISELPPGVQPERWRFADRNRLMAALAHVVVVVESHGSGGALFSVEAARQRGNTVMAVPGSVHSVASVGTNALLADGAPPARDVEDILTAVELAIAGDRSIASPRWPKVPHERASRTGQRSKPPSGICALVFSVLETEPASLEQVVRRCGSTIGETAAALDQLEELALADGVGGWWRRRGRALA
jgi:DNA processing protein